MDSSSPSAHLHRFRWYRRSRLWVVPSLGVAAALLLAAGSLTIDYFALGDEAPFVVFTGEADTARTMLSLIATSIATLTALVLTIVAVVIQLATQSLSPRAVRTFLQDAHSHLTIGTFVATFTYALVALQQLDLIQEGTGDETRVTSYSLTIAFVLAIISIGMFISYVNHIVHEARITSIIDRIGNETRAVIEQQYPAHEQAPAPAAGDVPARQPDLVLRAPGNGVILESDLSALVEAARRCEAVVVMIPAVGDFIPTGGRLFEVYADGDGADLDVDALTDAVEIDAERSIAQDVPFGMRLLIDIAERSLSSGINDPTTATQVIDQLHDLLRLLGTRPFPTGWHADGSGTPRVRVPLPSWDMYVALAFEEIRFYGSSSLQVVRRIRSAIEDLAAELPAERHPALQRQARMLDEAVEHAFPSEALRQAATYPDAQGIGSGAGFDPQAQPDSSRS